MKKLLLIIVPLLLVFTIVFVIRSNETLQVVQTESEALEVPPQSLVVTLFESVDVEKIGNLSIESGSDNENRKTFGGVEFTITPVPNPPSAGDTTTLVYYLQINGQPASDMETSMGVYGKGVAVRKGSKETVPVEIVKKRTPHGTLEFQTVFPQSGDYLVITQFKRGGEVITTHFEIKVI